MDAADPVERPRAEMDERVVDGAGRAAVDGGWAAAVIRVPIWVVAFAIVLPARLVAEAVGACALAVHRAVLVPLGRGLARCGAALAWLVRTLVIAPLAAVGRALAWCGRILVVVPLVWLYEQVLIPVRWLYRNVLTPLGHGVARLVRTLGAGLAALGRAVGGVVGLLAGAIWAGLRWVVHWLLVVPARAVGRHLLGPILRMIGAVLAVVGREVADAFGAAWRLGGSLARLVGAGLGWLARVLVVRPARWSWRVLVVPPARRLRRWVVRPVAAGVRAAGRWFRRRVWEPVRQAMGEVRRSAGQVTRSFRQAVRQARTGR